MARYDRIAPIPTPAREAAYPGWLMLRELAGRERDSELARRARLRFLALRPLLRILRQGTAGISDESFEKQLDGIREELGSLPARDPERVRLSRYLHQITPRVPADLTAAATAMGEAAEQAGHVSTAEEFYRTAGELAQASQLHAALAGAHARLGTLCQRLRRDEEAARHFAAAASAAEQASAPAEWARATCAGALLRAGRGDPSAQATIQDVLRRGQQAGDAEVRTIAALALADLALLDGDVEAALEASWSAAEGAAPPPIAVLTRGAAALRGLGLFDAALRCYDVLLDNATPEERWTARSERAAALAEAGRARDFNNAREQLLQTTRAEAPPPRATALMHLALARACLLVDATDFARDHLRDGLEATRRGACADIVPQLEALLPCLESAPAPRALARRSQPAPRVRAIADAIAALTAPVPA